MKQVSGTLRLELAQYREKAAFSQFGSDLDEATQKQLQRGEKLVEVLKQKQYQTLTMEKQVLSIFAATKGFLDECELSDVERYEKELHLFFQGENSQYLQQLADEEKISEELEKNLMDSIQTFNQRFFPEQVSEEKLETEQTSTKTMNAGQMSEEKAS